MGSFALDVGLHNYNRLNENSYQVYVAFLKKNLNASRPSEHPTQGGNMSKRLGGIIGCTDKTSSWHLNGFLYGSNIG